MCVCVCVCVCVCLLSDVPARHKIDMTSSFVCVHVFCCASEACGGCNFELYVCLFSDDGQVLLWPGSVRSLVLL